MRFEITTQFCLRFLIYTMKLYYLSQKIVLKTEKTHIHHYNCIWLCQLNGLNNLELIFLMKHKLGSLECQQTGFLAISYFSNFSLWFHGHKKAATSPGIAFILKAERNERKRNRNSMPADIIYYEITDFLKILPHRLPFTFHLPSLVPVAAQNCKRTWESEFLQLDALLSQIKLEFYIKKKEGMDVVQTIKAQATTLSRVSAYINLQ